MPVTSERACPAILIIEDDENLASALKDFFEDERWSVSTANTVAAARLQLSEGIFDLVLADYLLPDEDGLSVFEEIQARSPLTKVMLMTGVQDMEVAATAFRKGAADLIPKPFEINQLAQRIGDLMEARGEKILKDAPRTVRRLVDMVGESPAMRKVFRLIELVARRSSNVLISGESGTGKELVAKAIHQRSRRRQGPYVTINCGAIPDNLLEDELFGHVKGAYTDARQTRVGKFEQADGGTIFLDEIGTMPASLQVKLLRVLEERRFQRLGSNRDIEVDVRIIAATNADLREQMKNGEFREDLFYRLNVVPIHLPPIRERREDIPLLVNYFLEQFAEEDGGVAKMTDPAVLRRLIQYPWPGNVRELRNSLELACVLSQDPAVLHLEDFPILQESDDVDAETPLLDAYLQLPEEGVDLNMVVSELEKHLICQSLRRTGGNKGKAARLLYLKRTTLVEKLRRMNLLEEFSS